VRSTRHIAAFIMSPERLQPGPQRSEKLDPRASRSILTIIVGGFASFDIIYVNRLANKAAHSYAHRASAARRGFL
jgi:hypothetical protein